MHHLAVIIPTFNRIGTLRILLNQLLECKTPPDLSVVPVVVVDGSTDGTVELLRLEFQSVHVVQGTGFWWWTKSINEGIKYARSLSVSHFLLLNDDSEIGVDYLQILWNDYLYLNDPKAILGCISVSLEKPHRVDFAGSSKLDFKLMRPTHYLSPLSLYSDSLRGINETWTLNGRGTLFGVEVVDVVGLFDERLEQYGSDFDFAISARRMGLGVYISWNAVVWNNLYMTSSAASFQKKGWVDFLKSFMNRKSVNSLYKENYLYKKHGISIFAPAYLLLFVIAAVRARIIRGN